jgi:ABC-2 type transport system permease protein
VDRLAAGGEMNVARGSRSEAIDLVRHGKETAYIIVPRGFGQAAGRMFYGQPPRVELGIDPSRRAESGMLQGLVMKYGVARMQQMFSDPAAGQQSIDVARRALPPAGASPRADATANMLDALSVFLKQQPSASPSSPSGSGDGWQPLIIDKRDVTGEEQGGPHSAFDFTFPQGVLWGVLGCVMSFAVGLVVERTHGTLVRLQTAPLTRAHVLAGKALACFIAVMGMQMLLFILGTAVFGLRVHSVPMLGAAMLSIATAFVGIMMLVAAIGRHEQTTSGAGWALLMPMSMIGGGMIPLFVMPPWLVSLSVISPVKWAILALEGATWRGFAATEMILPCLVLIGVGAAAFFIGTKAVRTL